MSTIALCAQTVVMESVRWDCLGCDVNGDNDPAPADGSYQHALSTGHEVLLTTSKSVKLSPSTVDVLAAEIDPPYPGGMTDLEERRLADPED